MNISDLREYPPPLRISRALRISPTSTNIPKLCEYLPLLRISPTSTNIPELCEYLPPLRISPISVNIPHLYEHPRSLWISPTSTNIPDLCEYPPPLRISPNSSNIPNLYDIPEICEYPRPLWISPISVNNSLRIVPISPATNQHHINLHRFLPHPFQVTFKMILTNDAIQALMTIRKRFKISSQWTNQLHIWVKWH